MDSCSSTARAARSWTSTRSARRSRRSTWGKFLAHLRAHTEKLRRSASVSFTLGEEVAEWFLRAYVTAAGDQLADGKQLRARTTLYDAMPLLRLALRSQHDFDETRLHIATGLLEERMSAIAATESRT